MKEIKTGRLLLRAFKESDYDDLFEYLSQLENDEFEGYPGITYENGRDHLKYRIESNEFYAIELLDSGKVIGNIYCGSTKGIWRQILTNRDLQRRKIT